MTDVVLDPNLPEANRGLASLDALAAQTWVLEPPAPHELPDLLRDEAGLLLDGLIVRVARGRGALDVALGEGLASLAIGDRALRLGYSGIGDYARERLGVAGRTAQAMARLARGLRDRPLLREAVLAGEVGARKAQAVLAVARGEAEAAWVARARAGTVRALEAAARAEAAATPDEEEEEEWDRVWIQLPPGGKAKLDEAMALAGKVLDAPTAPKWQRLEAICQEYLSAHPVEPGDDEAAAPLSFPVVEWLEDAKAALESETRQWEFLCAPAAVPADAAGVDEAGGDPFRLDEELRRLGGMRDRWDELLGHLAMLVRMTWLWRDMQFASFGQFCSERLGMSRRAVEQRIWLSRRFYSLPALRQALREGRLSYEKARLVAGCSDESTVESWIVRAERTTCIALRREIEAEEEKQMCAREQLGLRVPRRVRDLLSQAFRAAQEAAGAWLPAGECLVRVAEHFIATWKAALKEKSTLQSRVRARDRGLCQVPGCSRAGRHTHHVVFRSHGGSDDPPNLLSMCAAHHLHGVHAGYIRVVGRAPDGLTWEIGLRPDGPPMNVFSGPEARA